MRHLIIALFAITSLTACLEPAPQIIKIEGEQAQADTPAPEEAQLELRTYTLDKGHKGLAYQTLRPIFPHVVDGPGNTLVVSAKPADHKGIQDFLEQLASLPKQPPLTQSRVRMSYWLVKGRPSAEPSVGQGLSEITPTLSSISKDQGDMEFELVERFELLSSNGEHASANGRYAKLEQGLLRNEAGLLLDIELALFRGAEMRTRLHLAPGETLVLGQVGALEDRSDLAPGVTQRTRRQVTMIVEDETGQAIEKSPEALAKTAHDLRKERDALLFFVARASFDNSTIAE